MIINLLIEMLAEFDLYVYICYSNSVDILTNKDFSVLLCQEGLIHSKENSVKRYERSNVDLQSSIFAVFVTIRDFVARAKNNNAIESY